MFSEKEKYSLDYYQLMSMNRMTLSHAQSTIALYTELETECNLHSAGDNRGSMLKALGHIRRRRPVISITGRRMSFVYTVLADAGRAVASVLSNPQTTGRDMKAAGEDAVYEADGGSGVVLKIKVGYIRWKQCGRGGQAPEARIEAQQAPKGCMGCEEGVSLSPVTTGGGVWKEGCAPSRIIFFALGSQNVEFWCILLEPYFHSLAACLPPTLTSCIYRPIHQRPT